MSTKWGLLLAATAVMAAPGAAPAATELEYAATLYGWFPGVSSTVETPVGTVESEVGFDEILEDLDVAFFGALEARKGRLSLVGDLQYIDLGVEAEPPPNPLFSAAEVDSKLVLLGAYAFYALVDTPNLRFDVGVGARHVDASIDTHLKGRRPAPDASFAREGSWTDGIVTGRITRQINDRWYGVAYADVGGFGIGESSDLTWQAFAGGGYRLNKAWSAIGGYKHLTIERTFGAFDVKADVGGPFLGFQAKF
jgi:hypothetical protein